MPQGHESISCLTLVWRWLHTVYRISPRDTKVGLILHPTCVLRHLEQIAFLSCCWWREGVRGVQGLALGGVQEHSSPRALFSSFLETSLSVLGHAHRRSPHDGSGVVTIKGLCLETSSWPSVETARVPSIELFAMLAHELSFSVRTLYRSVLAQ